MGRKYARKWSKVMFIGGISAILTIVLIVLVNSFDVTILYTKATTVMSNNMYATFLTFAVIIIAVCVNCVYCVKKERCVCCGARRDDLKLLELACHHHICLPCYRERKGKSQNAICPKDLKVFKITQSIQINTDACKDGGGAVVSLDGDWLFVRWRSDDPDTFKQQDCNVWEFSIIKHAVKRWSKLYPGYHFDIYSDSASAIHVLNTDDHRGSNKVTGKNKQDVNKMLRAKGITVAGFRIRKEDNAMADSISRLATPQDLYTLKDKMGNKLPSINQFRTGHMSEKASENIFSNKI